MYNSFSMAKDVLETKRLILRHWKGEDAESLYKYASNPDIGPIAGWPVHQSIQDSIGVIKNVFAKPYTYSVVLKETNEPIGCINLMIGKESNLKLPDNEGEIGYWIGVPYWGQGLIPEAAKEIIRFAFEVLKLQKLWCGYFVGNDKSKRVSEKCGFRFAETKKDVSCAIQGLLRDEHITSLSYAEWSAIK